jgi:TM2 domain-containing membrane protein YozV
MEETSPKPAEEAKAEGVTPEATEEAKAEGVTPKPTEEAKVEETPRESIAEARVEVVSSKSRLAVTLFAFFLGYLGIHRFYLGKIGTGIAMLLTVGGIGIWALVDFIMAVSGTMKDKEGNLIKNW